MAPHDIFRQYWDMLRAAGVDALSLHELNAMADYNLARSQSMFGSYKNAFNQQAANVRKVPAHMMPDFMTWLKTTQPQTYEFLYSPQQFGTPVARERDVRTFAERRRQPYAYNYTQSKTPPKRAPDPPKQAPPKSPGSNAPSKSPEPCQAFRDECAQIGKSGRSCYLALSKKHHPDKGGSKVTFQRLNDCKDKL